MADIRYEVIGAGNENNRIVVSANCDDISVTICWIGRTVYDGECDDLYRDERLCTVVPLDPVKPDKDIPDYTGEYVWIDNEDEKVTVYYTVKRSCPPVTPPDCQPKCSDMEAYTVPKYITEGYSYPIEIHYQYYLTKEDEAANEVCSRVKKTGVDIIKLSDTEKFEGCDYSYKFVKEDDLPNCDGRICLVEKEDPCAMGTDLYLTVSLSKTVIPPNLSDEEGNPVFDDDWKILPADECFILDDEGKKQPVPITDNPEECQCCDVPGGCEEDGNGNPRYDENGKPIPYYTVYVSIVYKLVETDENCNKITETGMLKHPWHIPPCVNGCVITGKAGGRVVLESTSEGTKGNVSSKGGEIEFSIGTQKPTRETHPCCFEHPIIGETSIADIKQELKEREKIGNVEDIKSVYYNGIRTNKDKISYTVKMQAKKDGECSGICTQTDKYAVVSGTTKVYYETEYMSDKWVSEDTPTCDCNALTLYDEESGYVDSPYSVPFYGGRIKVEWDYVRHSVSDECDEYYTYGTWEEIIMIGGCDERPTDCNICNWNGSSQGETVEGCDCDALQIFDTECKVCDAECCYDDFGGKCSLLFKEQFPEFWNDMLMCDNGKSKLTIYKCRECGALTPVMSDAEDCEPPVPVDENNRRWCPSCERVGDDLLEAIPFDMTHEYVETPIYECANCHAKLQSPGLGADCQYIPPASCPYCHYGENGYPPLEVTQTTTGEWYNKVRYKFNQDCNKICDYKTYVAYDHQTVTVGSGETSYVGEVSFTSTTEFLGDGCPQDKVVTGKEPVNETFDINNTTFNRTIRDDEVITIIQLGSEEDISTCGCGYLEFPTN